MKFASRFLVFSLIAALLVAAMGNSRTKAASSAADAAQYTIAIKDFRFAPRDLKIPVGTKVTWVNQDEEPHKVAEVNSAFTSQPLDTDGKFTYEFDKPGNFEYFCTLHPRMTGKIVVEAK
jgi:plastocyanin